MMATMNPIQKLAALLESTDAKPVIVPSRLAPSVIYDVDYRSSVVALVFKEFAKPFVSGPGRRMSGAKLKLFQFVAIRPWLLPAVREWSTASSQASLLLAYPIRVRRGFLSDTAHEDFIDFLVACGMLIRQDRFLVSGIKVDELDDIAAVATSNGLFENEINVISALGHIKLTTSMLEGW